MNGGITYRQVLPASRRMAIGIVLVIALLAFELFNFDTTEFALENLLGEKSFAGLRWATILAVAFCAIDFAGLMHLFTPEKGLDEPKEVWYLMGAWLLGATMNAMMTWWAISLTLLEHQFGNEVLSRAQLLQIVPIFVAALVWLTRILFIGALSIAAEHLFSTQPATATKRPTALPRPRQTTFPPTPHQTRQPQKPRPAPKPVRKPQPNTRPHGRVRPPLPLGMQARPRR